MDGYSFPFFLYVFILTLKFRAYLTTSQHTESLSMFFILNIIKSSSAIISSFH